MNRKAKEINKKLRLSIIILFPLTLILYLLRGFGLLGFLPGGVLLFFIIISVFIFIFFLITETYS